MHELTVETLSELKNIFPEGYAKLRSEKRAQGYAKEFLLALTEEKIESQDMLDRALAKAREHSKTNPYFPPAWMFVSWCKPSAEDFGLPSPEVAFRIAGRESGKRDRSQRNWQHPEIYEAAVRVNILTLATAPEQVTKKPFLQAYSQVLAERVGGQVFTVPQTHRVEHKREINQTRNKKLQQEWLRKMAELFPKEPSDEIIEKATAEE